MDVKDNDGELHKDDIAGRKIFRPSEDWVTAIKSPAERRHFYRPYALAQCRQVKKYHFPIVDRDIAVSDSNHPVVDHDLSGRQQDNPNVIKLSKNR
jgi:hypothetical protein